MWDPFRALIALHPSHIAIMRGGKQDGGKESSDEAKEEEDELRGRKTNKETGLYEYYYAFP